MQRLWTQRSVFLMAVGVIVVTAALTAGTVATMMARGNDTTGRSEGGGQSHPVAPPPRPAPKSQSNGLTKAELHRQLLAVRFYPSSKSMPSHNKYRKLNYLYRSRPSIPWRYGLDGYDPSVIMHLDKTDGKTLLGLWASRVTGGRMLDETATPDIIIEWAQRYRYHSAVVQLMTRLAGQPVDRMKEGDEIDLVYPGWRLLAGRGEFTVFKVSGGS